MHIRHATNATRSQRLFLVACSNPPTYCTRFFLKPIPFGTFVPQFERQLQLIDGAALQVPHFLQ
jgi:hypothetical protein